MKYVTGSDCKCCSPARRIKDGVFPSLCRFRGIKKNAAALSRSLEGTPPTRKPLHATPGSVWSLGVQKGSTNIKVSWPGKNEKNPKPTNKDTKVESSAGWNIHFWSVTGDALKGRTPAVQAILSPTSNSNVTLCDLSYALFLSD